MSNTDSKIVYNGKTHYAAYSTTSDLYFSPAFESLDDYARWLVENSDRYFRGFYKSVKQAKKAINFEYKPRILSPEGFADAQKAIQKYLSGKLPNEQEVKSLNNVYMFFRELVEVDIEKLSAVGKGGLWNKLTELGIKRDPKFQYETDQINEYISFATDPELAGDLSETERKFVGWYFDNLFSVLDHFKFDSISELFEKAFKFRKSYHESKNL